VNRAVVHDRRYELQLHAIWLELNVTVGVLPATPTALLPDTETRRLPEMRRLAIRAIKLGFSQDLQQFLVWRSAMIAPNPISGRNKRHQEVR